MTHTTFILAANARSNRKHVTTVIRPATAATRTATTAPRSRPFIVNCSADFLPKQRFEIR